MGELSLLVLVLLAALYGGGIFWVLGTCTAGFLLHWQVIQPRSGSLILSSSNRALGISIASAGVLFVVDVSLHLTGVL